MKFSSARSSRAGFFVSGGETEKPYYGDLIYTVAATFKSREAQSEDCGYGIIENALNRVSVLECASPLALCTRLVIESARGLAQSKTLRLAERIWVLMTTSRLDKLLPATGGSLCQIAVDKGPDRA